MAEKIHYVPIFKTKQAELASLARLGIPQRELVIPLLEIPDVPYDFEKGLPRKTPFEHVKKIPQAIWESWNAYPLYLDSAMDSKIEADHRAVVQGLRTAVGHVAGQLLERGGRVIPCVGLSSSGADLEAIMAILARNKGDGAAIRVRLGADVDAPELAARVMQLLETLGLSPKDSDLILDFASLSIPFNLAAAYLRELALELAEPVWRRVILASTSFPVNLSSIVPDTIGSIERLEWRFFQALRKNVGSFLEPIYSDYGISSSDQPEIDPRVMSMSASIRYTLENTYFIVKGRSIKLHGWEQIYELCKRLTDSPNFLGADFSPGDAQIATAAAGEGETGNATTWRQAGLSHHLAFVLNQVSS